MKPHIGFIQSQFGDCARLTPTTALHNISTVASKHTSPRSAYVYRARSKHIRAFNAIQPSCLNANATLAKLSPLVLSLCIDGPSRYPEISRYKAALTSLLRTHILSRAEKRDLANRRALHDYMPKKGDQIGNAVSG